MGADIVRWNETDRLASYDAFIIAGGFSYEDRGRSGVIAANDPVMKVITKEAEKGKPVLGICNGAQILVESGLVPGGSGDVGFGLARNKRMRDGAVVGTGFYNDWVYVRCMAKTAFTHAFSIGDVIPIPVAHGEGRFVGDDISSAAFCYCDKGGGVLDEYPVNPNGSVGNIAAVCNASGNVMAIMPHPERCAFNHQLPPYLRDETGLFHKGPGMKMIESMLMHMKKKVSARKRMENVHANRDSVSGKWERHNVRLRVSLIITDDEAISMRNAIRKRFPVTDVKKEVLWDIGCEDSLVDDVIRSGELMNTNKERVVSSGDGSHIEIEVRDRDDMLALSKCRNLNERHGLKVSGLKRSVVWRVYVADPKRYADDIVSTLMFHNPYSQEFRVEIKG